MAKVAFLGLGVMGFPMARHLAAKGHDVTVYNRTTAKAEAWVKAHGAVLPRRRVKPPKVRTLSLLVSAMMMICGK